MKTKFRTATQWGVYDVEVEDQRIVGVHGLPEDPAPSPMGRALVDGIQHPLRIRRPSIRRQWLAERDRNLRGADEFVDVPWDEALDLAANEIQWVIQHKGNEGIYAGSYGWASAGRFHHAQSQLHRFMNLLGGCTRALNSYSTAAAQIILPRVVAPWSQIELEQPSWTEIAEHTQVFVAFGGLPLRNTQVAYGGITEHQSRPGVLAARAAGVRFINVSPLQSDYVGPSDWLAIRPGTDVALMLGLAFELVRLDKVDQEFISKNTVGYDQFLDYLKGVSDGQPKTPLWAAGVCGIAPGEIAALAELMAGQCTFVTAAWSLQRAQYGEQPYWTLVVLAAMLGGIGLPGQGFGFGYGAEGFVGSPWRRFHWATFPKGPNPAGSAIPVARIADMLEKPGAEYHYDGGHHRYPDIDLIYWAGGNPFHHHQDLNRLVSAWRKPRTVIVNEPWWTPIAKWADIVFPATTNLEREDICASSHDPYAHIMEAALPPQHEARSDHEIFCGLSKHLGILDAFTEGRSPRQWMEQMWQRSADRAETEGFRLPSFADFWSARTFKVPEDEQTQRTVWLSAFRASPENAPLSTPSGKIEIYSETIAALNLSDCPGHPAWQEPDEYLRPSQSSAYPLALLSPQPARRLHSQLDHAQHSQNGKQDGREILRMHPSAAKARGITAGDVVRVFNDRGATLAGVRLVLGMREDVVVLPTGAWFDPIDPVDPFLDNGGNPNVLTKDQGTSQLAQGPSSGTCLVEVERYQP